MADKEFTIKDSGDRRSFESGAVRDVDDSKPRFGLIPITVLVDLLEYYEQYNDESIHVSVNGRSHMSDENKNLIMTLGFLWGNTLDPSCLYTIIWICLDTVRLQENDTTPCIGKNDFPGFHLISPKTYERLAMHYGRGAQKYDPWNWSRGMPLSVFYESLMRHIFKIIQNDEEEDHLSAVFFNAAAILHFQHIGRDDLDDMTPRLKEWYPNAYN